MKQRLHHIFWFWLPALGYMIAIFSVSSISHPQIGGNTPDYVLHTLEYFLLALLLMRLFLSQPPYALLHRRFGCYALTSSRNPAENFRLWRAICICGALLTVAYGISDEAHQYFTPGRHCSLHDVGADAFGAFLAYSAAILDFSLLRRTNVFQSVACRFSRLKTLSYLTYLM